MQIRDEKQINHGDEKIVLKILRKGYDSKFKNTFIGKFQYNWYKLLNRFFVKYMNGANIPIDVKIGGGCRLVHCNGIIMNGNVQIGDNVTLFQQITIGLIEGRADSEFPPHIGDNVYIGAGANVLGNIKVGNNVIIGANAVVTVDVPNNCTVVGYNRIISKLENQDVNS